VLTIHIIYTVFCFDLIFTGKPPLLTVNIIKNITSLSLFVQWNAVDDVINYVLTWSGGGFATTRMTSHTITRLTVGATYTITVSATNKCGEGPEFTTSILFSPDTTSTTTIISPTITTVNKSSSNNTTDNDASGNDTTFNDTTGNINIITMPPTSITKVSNSVDSASKFLNFAN